MSPSRLHSAFVTVRVHVARLARIHRAERRKVVPAHKAGGGAVQALEVERIPVMQHPVPQKRVRRLPVPDAVDIFLALAGIPGVKVRRHLAAGKHGNIRPAENGSARRPAFRTGMLRSVWKLTQNSSAWTNESVRLQPFDVRALAENLLQRFLKDLLNRHGVLLNLPAVVVRAVIADGQQQIAHRVIVPFHVERPYRSAAGKLTAQKDHGAAENSRAGDGGRVELRHVELLHLGASFAAVVAAALHRHGKVVGPAERRNEKRDQDRDKRPDALHDAAAFHIGAARLLCAHDLVGFFEQRRHKAQGNGHHHGDLMHLDMKDLQRLHDALQRVGQFGRRRGERQHRAEKDQA